MTLMTANNVAELEQQGFTIVRQVINNEWLEKLRGAVDGAFAAHREIQIKNGNDITTGGVALHVILSNNVFIEFLDEFIRMGFIEDLRQNYFKSNFILNSFSALDNMPNQLNFSSIIHRDLRFYTGNVPVMLNTLVMLDDFTEENGPTLLLAGSHKKLEKPTDEYFHANATKALGKAGDVLIFNANVWHASSLNTSSEGRRAMPLTFTKSLIKQLLDYPRALGYDKMDSFKEDLRQLLGYHARVPASLDEWYMPFEQRFYKKDQD